MSGALHNTVKTIDIVLASYNPHKNWEVEVYNNFQRIKNIFKDYTFKLYIATDGSDHVYEEDVLQWLHSHIDNLQIVHYENNMGKGYALRNAVGYCQSQWIIYIDYDFPYTDDSIANVVDALENGADVVVASRSNSYQMQLSLYRKLLSQASHCVNKILFNLPYKDTQGGMKGFNQRGRKVFLKTTINTFLFDTQFVYQAYRQDLKISAVQGQIKPNIKMSAMGMNVLLKELTNIPQIWIS